MKSREILCALVALLILLLLGADLGASDTATITKAILNLDSERADALTRRDFAVLDRLLGNDLTYIHASGVVQNKADFLADLRSGKRIYTSIKSSDLNVRLLRGAAVITGLTEIHVTVESKESDLSLRVTEVYAKRKGRWQLIAYQSTRKAP
jgi:hypothetical protein